MKRIIFAIITLFTVLAVPFAGAHAQVNVFQECTGTNANTSVCKATSDKLFGAGGIWNNILNVFTYVIGAVAVLMIIIGGFRYVTSNGDANQVTSAKNTIMYAVIGLVVAILANAIVNFVLTNI